MSNRKPAARPGHVSMVDPSDLGMVREIAQALGVSAQSVCNWVRRYDDFPAPVTILSTGALYHVPSVVAWHVNRTTT